MSPDARSTRPLPLIDRPAVSMRPLAFTVPPTFRFFRCCTAGRLTWALVETFNWRFAPLLPASELKFTTPALMVIDAPAPCDWGPLMLSVPAEVLLRAEPAALSRRAVTVRVLPVGGLMRRLL